ncbi:amidase [Agaricicola taiwanensis]|uniref:Amidase n=1 Tax=Agaricicola taiwanensis TaxID=591372 RepID=A0A8J2YFJ0_9RHOB|nr:DUF4169 family protein [Agaricicola taiwanensis]GGE42516.1 amidase [Agaricicola taiwanensis]
MAEVINLNKARKAKTRDEKTARAEQNRVSFGRTKAEKDVERMKAEQAARNLDGHRRGRDEP